MRAPSQARVYSDVLPFKANAELAHALLGGFVHGGPIETEERVMPQARGRPRPVPARFEQAGCATRLSPGVVWCWGSAATRSRRARVGARESEPRQGRVRSGRGGLYP
jgi:hypothetical protein